MIHLHAVLAPSKIVGFSRTPVCKCHQRPIAPRPITFLQDAWEKLLESVLNRFWWILWYWVMLTSAASEPPIHVSLSPCVACIMSHWIPWYSSELCTDARFPPMEMQFLCQSIGKKKEELTGKTIVNKIIYFLFRNMRRQFHKHESLSSFTSALAQVIWRGTYLKQRPWIRFQPLRHSVFNPLISVGKNITNIIYYTISPNSEHTPEKYQTDLHCKVWKL